MVVANSTPLIYLAALSDFHLLRDLYGTVIIPQAVFDEVVPQAIGFPVKAAVESALQSWLSMGTVRDHHRVSEIARTSFLDPGEAEAIVLAQEADVSRILLDDQAAVTCARKLGLDVTRTPLIYGEARLRNWVPSLKEKLDDLRSAGFWLSDEHYRLVLSRFGTE